MVTISVCESWTLTRVADAAQVNATLWWNDSHECSPDYINDPNDLVVARWSGQWDNLGGAGVTLVSPGGHITSTSLLDAATNTLTFGSVSTENTLPVELTGLQIVRVEKGAKLKWQTASETDNAYFTIERRKGDNFISIGRVPGAGTKNLPTIYEWTDTNPPPGLSHYRLRQTDFDGKETFSKMVPFRWEKEGKPYPNPVKNLLYLDRLTIDEDSHVAVADVSGGVVYAGRFKPSIDFSEFAPGVYQLMITTRQDVRRYSIIKD